LAWQGYPAGLFFLSTYHHMAQGAKMVRKITLAKKKKILELKKQGIELQFIAERFGVSTSTIVKIMTDYNKEIKQNG